MSSTTQAGTPKRTRSQQREETRSSILDATIACLVESGYAGTTTRAVAERAGLSQGAVQHYYPTKTELVDAAVRHTADETAALIVRHYGDVDGSEDERIEALIDMLWMLGNAAPTEAGFQLVTASRTDPELAASVVNMISHLETVIFSVAEQLVPHITALPGAREWARLTSLTIGSVVLFNSIPGNDANAFAWDAVRSQVLGGFRAWREQAT